MDAEELSQDFLDYLNGLSDDEGLLETGDLIDKYVDSEDFDKAQKELSNFVNDTSDKITGKAKRLMVSGDFIKYTNKEAALVIREYFGVGASVGYELTAAKAFDLYGELIKYKGSTSLPVLGELDSLRLKDSIAGVIKKTLENRESIDGATKLEGSFGNIIRSGERDTIQNTAMELDFKSGLVLVGKRVLSASDPCDYCKEMAGIQFPLHLPQVDNWGFHDFCRCRVELVFDSFS